MAKRYVIRLSRKDIGLVSYFPALEVKNDPDADWIETALVPAVQPIVKRKDRAIRGVPITFWVSVRDTARRKAEVFLFTTPARPGTRIEQAIKRSLQSINGGNVHAGREPIPWLSFPSVQVFRGRLIRFYITIEGHEGFHLPVIRWGDRAPELDLCDIPEKAVTVTDEQAERLWVRAEVSTVLDGEYLRRFQQALSTIAREET